MIVEIQAPSEGHMTCTEQGHVWYIRAEGATCDCQRWRLRSHRCSCGDTHLTACPVTVP